MFNGEGRKGVECYWSWYWNIIKAKMISSVQSTCSSTPTTGNLATIPTWEKYCHMCLKQLLLSTTYMNYLSSISENSWISSSVYSWQTNTADGMQAILSDRTHTCSSKNWILYLVHGITAYKCCIPRYALGRIQFSCSPVPIDFLPIGTLQQCCTVFLTPDKMECPEFRLTEVFQLLMTVMYSKRNQVTLHTDWA